MSVSFPPSRRTSTLDEALRLAKLTGMANDTDVVRAIRDRLDKEVAERPFKLDYVNERWSDTDIGHVCLLTNSNGDRQFWLGLNVAHPFVQSIIDFPKAQRDGIEVMLLVMFGAHSDLDDPEVDLHYQREWNEIGTRLYHAIPILNDILWPNGKPEEEDEEDADAMGPVRF